jgi:hypothetical protein
LGARGLYPLGIWGVKRAFVKEFIETVERFWECHPVLRVAVMKKCVVIMDRSLW